MTTDAPKRRGRPPAGGKEAILSAAGELLRERGIGRLTTREVAQKAGVSEASVFYHYGDRTGLLTAVFEDGMRPLQAVGQEGGIAGLDRREALTRLGRALERFLDGALPVMNASQSDVELRDAMTGYMGEHDLGPHRGVQVLGGYLRAEQKAGRVRSDIDADAVALTFVGACLTRASQRQLPVRKVRLPSIESVVAALDAMLEPV